MTVFSIIWKYRRFFVIGVLFLGVLFALHSYGERRYAAGAAHVQTKWDNDSKARDATVERMAREHAARDAATRARNEVVANEFQEQISRIAADRDSLARRLRDNEVRIRTLPSAADQPGAAEPRNEPESQRGADAALDAYDRACRSDAAQLDALIRQIQRQLDSLNTAG